MTANHKSCPVPSPRKAGRGLGRGASDWKTEHDDMRRCAARTVIQKRCPIKMVALLL